MNGTWNLFMRFNTTTTTKPLIPNEVQHSRKKKYQIKSTESPATSLFALTNTLQPVVSRCLFG
jgi:hypothetical protein